MRYNTKRYDIRKIDDDGEFNESVKYEINLKNGYIFGDGSRLAYAEDHADLIDLINDIKAQ